MEPSNAQGPPPSGTVVAWGFNGLGQTNVPTNLSGVIAISASGHSVALKEDGTVVAWGDNRRGQSAVPSGLSGVIAIAAGQEHTLAVKGDGTVVAWGRNDETQSNVPSGLNNVTAVSGGRFHSVALKSDGTVVAWGLNSVNQTSVPAGLSDVIAIDAGFDHTLALKSDGTVVAWGDNSFGQSNVPSSLSGVVAISAGGAHSMALKGDGTVVTWGDNTSGQRTVPGDLGVVQAVAAGGNHSVALLSSGRVRVWGVQLQPVPTGLIDVFAVAAGDAHTLALVYDAKIGVAGNAEVITNGDSTPSVTDHTEFGSTNVNGGSIDRTFTISNLGFGNLRLTGTPRVSVRGVHASNFKVIQQPIAVVAESGSSEFKVRFDPTAIGIRNATISITSNDKEQTPFTFAISGQGLSGPLLTVASPTSARAISAIDPLQVSGLAKDNVGIDRVEIILNGVTSLATLDQTIPTSVPFSAEISPLVGENVLEIVAYDGDGISATVTRTFTYERRYELTVARNVPVDQLATPDKAGTVSIIATPGRNSAVINKVGTPQNYAVLPGTVVKATAAAKVGYVFSHWNSLPAGATEAGTVATFTMGAMDANVEAVFVVNPFTAAAGIAPAFVIVPGAKTIKLQGLILPTGVTPESNGSVGFAALTLTTARGTLSGKVTMDGKVTSLTGVAFGDGSVRFRVGRVLSQELPLKDGTQLGKSLVMNWDDDGFHLTVSATGGLVSEGLARPARYSAASPVPPSLLNRSNGRQGYFTLAIPAKTQVPPMIESSYPQGTGYASVTLARAGTLRFVGKLADGTTATTSSYMTEVDGCPIFVSLTTPGALASVKGGSLLGELMFDTAALDSDLGGSDWRWFRPAVAETNKAATRIYTMGWPSGIRVDPVGALYNATIPAQTALNLGVESPVGNAQLDFEFGKLTGSVVKAFNVVVNKVVKLTSPDSSFSLTVVPSSGMIRGSFEPNWLNPAKGKPSFQGVLLQKGGNRGGVGYFLSNAVGDLDPESGAVTLGAP